LYSKTDKNKPFSVGSKTMNIFFLSLDPQQAAEYHCDKHVVKMIIETAQLLYCAHWVLPNTKLPENAYKKTHMNHPCSRWVRESLSNYRWLCKLGWYLCREYEYRYSKIHKTESHIVWLLNNPPEEIPDVGFTEPPQAMPDEYKDSNFITGYHTFYRESKMTDRNIVTYKKRDFPKFLVTM